MRVVLQPLTPEPEFAFSTDDEDESDEESEKESDFEEEIEEIASYEELKGIIDAMDDDDEVMHGTADRSAAEELFGAVPPPQLDIQVRPDDVLIPAGSVLSVIEGTIVVRAVAGSRALNEGSALVLQDGTPIGVVEDIFGPVQAPLYALRYAGPAVHAAPQPDSMPPSREPNGEEAVNGVEEDIDLEDAPAERAEVVVEGGKKAGMSGHGMPAALVPEALVFSVERLSNFVLPDDLRVKGYDADEVEKEGMEPAMEFSDDEAVSHQLTHSSQPNCHLLLRMQQVLSSQKTPTAIHLAVYTRLYPPGICPAGIRLS